MTFIDTGFVFSTFIRLLPFIPITLLIAAISMLLGLLLGFLLTVMKLGKNTLLQKFASGYTTIIRSTPTVVLLFLVFYGLPMVFGSGFANMNSWDKKIFTIIALSLYSSATLSEIMRPAYQAVDKGQYEAAVSVGLSNFQALKEVVAPQAVFIALPNLGNMFISLIHESALAYVIGTVDVMGQAHVIGSIGYGKKMLEVYLAASIIYWIMSVFIGKSTDTLVAYLGRSRLSMAINKVNG